MKDKNKSIERLQKAVDDISHLKNLKRKAYEFQKWQRDTTGALKHVFGEESTHVSEFQNIYYSSPMLDDYQSMAGEQQREYSNGLERAEALLDSMIDEIKDYCEDEENTEVEIDIPAFLTSISKQEFPFRITEPQSHVTHAAELIADGLLEGNPLKNEQGIPIVVMVTGMTTEGREYIQESKQKQESKKVVDNKKVFIVHGHDNEVKQTVARFVEKIKLTPIILDEQPNKNISILEKFEHNADVGFAIVLLTPDDKAVAKRALGDEKDRARQNVIFEMGYFIAKLGKQKVCAIIKGDIEIPSDYSGILRIEYGSEDWKNNLFKELRAAGFDIRTDDML